MKTLILFLGITLMISCNLNNNIESHERTDYQDSVLVDSVYCPGTWKSHFRNQISKLGTTLRQKLRMIQVM